MGRKKKKAAIFDEFYSNGLFELGRKDNIVSLKSHLTEEDVKKHKKEMAKQYDTKKREIDNKIAVIAEDIKKCNPLWLLLTATERGMMNLINIVSEIQIAEQKNFQLRAVEYIQSVLACQKVEHVDLKEQDELINKVLAEIDSLYMDVQMFYMIWAAKASLEDNALSDNDIEYIVEAQLMGNVRGKRYQFQQLNNIEKLLLPHSEKMQEVYNVSAHDLIEGLKKLEYSLSSARLDSIKAMYNSFLQFQREAEGKSFEEVDELLEQIANSEENIDLSAKCFGADLYDVKKITGWSDELINSLSWKLGECNDFLYDDEFAGWPIKNLPVQKRPFICIDDICYCFDYYNLFDNIYRIIQKDIKRHDNGYTNTWSDLQQEASESLVEEQLKKLLPGCESYVGNYYPIGQSLKQRDENDILVLFDDTLIIVEVKAGSFVYTPAMTDYNAHKKSFETLVGKADYQCERTLNYIKNNEKIVFYKDSKTKEKKVEFDRNKYRNIYTMCVTVDNFNVFEAKIEKNNFFNVSSGTIAISIDDLDAYVEYFSSPLLFLHFLKHRKAATGVKNLMLNDELDHLGMYIVHNAYEMYASEYENCNSFVATGYREDLDAYFTGLYCKKLQSVKPEQDIPYIIKEIISFTEEKNMVGNVAFSSFILDLDPDSRETFANSVNTLISRQAEIGRMFPVMVNGDVMYGLFIVQDRIQVVEEELRLKYMYANMLKVSKNQSWYIVLSYNTEKQLKNIQYKQLHIDDIEERGYNENELLQLAESIFQNRVKSILDMKSKKKIYPNDKCPCGSGKKYKQCCGKNK